MTRITVNFNKRVGEIKPMHAVGQPPFSGGFLSFDFSHIQYLQDANIPYSRLHDVGGAFGGNRFVDIPNIFRDFDADENDPESYDFAFTDVLLKALKEYGVEPYFRLGVTIENQAHIKAYRIHPPKDYDKWARICEHIVRHYNEGWADGFYYGIKYWEIWNEPENGAPGRNQMWTGTAEQFYRLYDVTAKHLKSCFGDSIMVGGYGMSGLYGLYYHPEKYGIDVPKREPDERYETDTYRIEFFHGFLEYIKEHKSPIDYFSWHSYANLEKTLVIDSYIYRKLCEYGHGDLEQHLNEWNNAHVPTLHGTSYASAANAAMMLAFAESGHVDMMHYYDAKITASTYGGFFAPLTFEPVSTYYTFYAYGQLYTLKNQVECNITDRPSGLYTLAASDGEKKAVMIVNFSEESRDITIDATGNMTVCLIDKDHYISETNLSPNNFTLEANQIAFIKNY
jgi:hypothetical protein